MQASAEKACCAQPPQPGAEHALALALLLPAPSGAAQVLYSHAAWVAWLHGLPTRHLVGLYLKYLSDAFQ